jgi:hypothetical protein
VWWWASDRRGVGAKRRRTGLSRARAPGSSAGAGSEASDAFAVELLADRPRLYSHVLQENGVYVTTGYFSRPTQTEVIQDRYPLLLVNGLRLAAELDKKLRTKGDPALGDLLTEIEAQHGRLTSLSDPDQVLFL